MSFDSFYESFDRFELARDRCNISGMRLEIATMEGRLESMRTALGQEANPRRQEQRRDEIRTAAAILESSRRASPINCPPSQQRPPPPPAVGTPVNPSPPTQDVMQGPLREPRQPEYYASLGGAYLFDGGLDLGLAQAGFDVDFPLSPDDLDESGLGNARLGTRFRLSGEVSAGVIDERNQAGGFRDSVGVNWSAAALAQIVLPLGDDEPASATDGADFSLFGGAGYGFARFAFELTGPGVDFSDSSTEDFFLFRAGAEVFFDGGANGVRASYTRWDDFERDGISANVVSVSYVRRFGGGR